MFIKRYYGDADAAARLLPHGEKLLAFCQSQKLPFFRREFPDGYVSVNTTTDPPIIHLHGKLDPLADLCFSSADGAGALLFLKTFGFKSINGVLPAKERDTLAGALPSGAVALAKGAESSVVSRDGKLSSSPISGVLETSLDVLRQATVFSTAAGLFHGTDFLQIGAYPTFPDYLWHPDKASNLKSYLEVGSGVVNVGGVFTGDTWHLWSGPNFWLFSPSSGYYGYAGQWIPRVVKITPDDPMHIFYESGFYYGDPKWGFDGPYGGLEIQFSGVLKDFSGAVTGYAETIVRKEDKLGNEAVGAEIIVFISPTFPESASAAPVGRHTLKEFSSSIGSDEIGQVSVESWAAFHEGVLKVFCVCADVDGKFDLVKLSPLKETLHSGERFYDCIVSEDGLSVCIFQGANYIENILYFNLGKEKAKEHSLSESRPYITAAFLAQPKDAAISTTIPATEMTNNMDVRFQYMVGSVVIQSKQLSSYTDGWKGVCDGATAKYFNWEDPCWTWAATEIAPTNDDGPYSVIIDGEIYQTATWGFFPYVLPYYAGMVKGSGEILLCLWSHEEGQEFPLPVPVSGVEAGENTQVRTIHHPGITIGLIDHNAYGLCYMTYAASDNAVLPLQWSGENGDIRDPYTCEISNTVSGEFCTFTQKEGDCGGQPWSIGYTDSCGRSIALNGEWPRPEPSISGDFRPTVGSTYSVSGVGEPVHFTITGGTINESGTITSLDGACGVGTVTGFGPCGQAQMEVQFPIGTWVLLSCNGSDVACNDMLNLWCEYVQPHENTNSYQVKIYNWCGGCSVLEDGTVVGTCPPGSSPAGSTEITSCYSAPGYIGDCPTSPQGGTYMLTYMATRTYAWRCP